jgi:hypothetical protein
MFVYHFSCDRFYETLQYLFICLFVIYLKALSVVQTVLLRMIEWLTDDEFGTLWEEEIVA